MSDLGPILYFLSCSADKLGQIRFWCQPMSDLGPILYVLLFAILLVFWWRTRRQSLGDLLERATRDHHHVHDVLAKHPRGGTWKDYKRWMQENSSL